MADFNNIFGGILRESRELKGLSQEQLGQKVGLSRASIANYEAGSQGISLEHAVLVAAELNLSLDQLKQSQREILIASELADADPRVKNVILDVLQKLKE